MGTKNPIFKKNYEDYLQKLATTDSSRWDSVLGVSVNSREKSAVIPFLGRQYTVSPEGIWDEQELRPDYGTCIILLKYLLMCPQTVPPKATWVHSRDFKDTVQAQNTGLAEYAAKNISEGFSGNRDLLKLAVSDMGAEIVENEFPYDLAAIIDILPRVPVLFLFNDKDDDFPAETSILYEDRAHHFLDAECRVMVDWYLYEKLNQVKQRHSK